MRALSNLKSLIIWKMLCAHYNLKSSKIEQMLCVKDLLTDISKGWSFVVNPPGLTAN